MTKKPYHVGAPNTGDRRLFDQLVDEIFERRWFTNGGELVHRFESRLCEYLGVKHCIPVCNATVGMQLVCHSLDLTGEVILPAFTFVATPHAVKWEGLKPVFADVDLESHTLCPQSVESLITDRTSAIIGVHVWGRPCQTDELQKIADGHQLQLIYDSAHAFGCSHQGKMIGNFGQCEVFSFHATKFFNTFEGGAIATNDDVLAEKIRLMKNFGFAGMDKVVHLGTNAKMSEISAAMGLSVFERIDEILAANRNNYLSYQELLADRPGIRLLNFPDAERTNWQYVVVEIDEREFGASRDQLFDHLNRNDVLARRYFFPGCHRMEPYYSEDGDRSDRLVNTERLCQSVLCLPTGTAIDRAAIEEICSLFDQLH